MTAAHLSGAVTVVFVAYNSAAVLGAAIASLPEGVPVIVSDNASSDGSAALAEARGARVIANSVNLGFGTACNRGAAAAETPLVLFLNPDARLMPGALEALVVASETHPEAAGFGPVLCDEAGPALPRAATLLEPDQAPMMTTVPVAPIEVGFLSGAALLVRRADFEALGGFDESIFLYMEDDDLCLRLRGAGHALMLIPKARVVHIGTGSSSPSSASLRVRNRETMRSMRYLARKHGVTLDFAGMRAKAWRRLIQAFVSLDRTRIAVNKGRLEGLGAWPFGSQTGGG